MSEHVLPDGVEGAALVRATAEPGDTIEMRCPDCGVWGDNPDGCGSCGRAYDDPEECFELRGAILDRATRALRLTPQGDG